MKKAAATLSTEKARTNAGIDYTAETATPNENYEVSTDGTNKATSPASLTSALNGSGTPTIYVRTAETDDTAAGAWVEVTLAARPDAPTGLGTAKLDNGKGTLTGMNDTMEYQLKGGSDWTAATDTNPVTLNAGTYLVRYAATSSAPAGKTAEVKVESNYTALTAEKPTVTLTKSDNNTEEGRPQAGDTLTATPSPDAASPVTFEWYRGTTKIDGATGSAYVLTADDVGKTIHVIAKQAANADGNGSAAVTSAASDNTAAVLKQTNTKPQIAANDLAAVITKADKSITINTPADGYEYAVVAKNGTIADSAWKSGDSALTFDGLTPGTEYDVVVRAKGDASTLPGAQTKTTVTTNVTVTINGGEPAEGKKLTAATTPASISGATYKWYRGDTPIDGATGKDYVPTAADVGKTLKVEVIKDGDALGSKTTETQVKSAADYISGLTSPATVTLDGPVTGNITIPAEKDITLDLNGQTVTGGVTVEANGTLTINDSSEPDAGKVTGAVTVHGMTTVNGGIFAGDVVNDGYTLIYDGTFQGTVTNKNVADSSNAVTIEGGKFDKRPVAEADSIYINGGKFKEDPSKAENGTDANPHVTISGSGKAFFKLDDNEYPYQLADKPSTVADVKVDQGKTVAEVAAAIDNSVKTDAENTAKSTEANLEDTAVEQVKQIVAASQNVTDENKNIVIVPALEVKMESYTVSGGSATLTMDIEATYTSYETDQSITNATGVENNKNDASKVKQIGSGKLDTAGTPVTVKFEVPATFASALNANTSNTSNNPVKVYVKHTHDGKNYEYNANL